MAKPSARSTGRKQQRIERAVKRPPGPPEPPEPQDALDLCGVLEAERPLYEMAIASAGLADNLGISTWDDEIHEDQERRALHAGAVADYGPEHRARMADVTDESWDAPEGFVVVRFHDGPASKRMSMSPLVRTALRAMSAAELWWALHAFDAHARRTAARAEFAMLIERGSYAVTALRSYMVSRGSFDAVDRHTFEHLLSTALAAIRDVAAAWERGTRRAPRGGRDDRELRLASTGWLVETLEDVGMRPPDIARLIQESATWPEPPCPAWCAEYAGEDGAKRMAPTLRADANELTRRRAK